MHLPILVRAQQGAALHGLQHLGRGTGTAFAVGHAEQHHLQVPGLRLIGRVEIGRAAAGQQ
jgi:hypothetical protein